MNAGSGSLRLRVLDGGFSWADAKVRAIVVTGREDLELARSVRRALNPA